MRAAHEPPGVEAGSDPLEARLVEIAEVLAPYPDLRPELVPSPSGGERREIYVRHAKNKNSRVRIYDDESLDDVRAMFATQVEPKTEEQLAAEHREERRRMRLAAAAEVRRNVELGIGSARFEPNSRELVADLTSAVIQARTTQTTRGTSREQRSVVRRNRRTTRVHSGPSRRSSDDPSPEAELAIAASEGRRG